MAASAAKTKLGALFVNTEEAHVIYLLGAELGHRQPPTPIHVDSTKAVRTVNSAIKCKCSCLMEMIYCLLIGQTLQRCFKFYYQPGAEIMADYSSNVHIGPIRTPHTCKTILHTPQQLSSRVSMCSSA